MVLTVAHRQLVKGKFTMRIVNLVAVAVVIVLLGSLSAAFEVPEGFVEINHALKVK